MTTITLQLYEANRHQFNWFQSKWMDAWKYVASKLPDFRNGYEGFYIAPDRFFFTTNFDLTDKELIELVSFATWHYNDFLSSKKPMVLTANKYRGENGKFMKNYLNQHYTYTCELFKQALTTYYSDQQDTLFGDEVIDIKPEFKYGWFWGNNNEWETQLDVTSNNDHSSSSRNNPYPSIDEIEQTEHTKRT